MPACRFPYLAVAFLLPVIAASSQQPVVPAAGRVLTYDDYAKAERWMNYNVNGLVKHTIGGVQYLPDGRVFFRDPGAEGLMYMLADAASGSVTAAFDREKVAKAVKLPSGQLDPSRLAVSDFKPDASGSGFTVTLQGGQVHCTSPTGQCVAVAPKVPPTAQTVPKKSQDNAKTPPAPPVRAGRRGGRGQVNASPDKKLAIFIRDYNLWLRVTATGEEKQLTTDGVKDFGYATDNAGWQHTDAVIGTWSADGTKFATFQQDQRKVRDMYLMPVTNRHPGAGGLEVSACGR